MNRVDLPFALFTTLYALGACTDGPHQTITHTRSPCGTEPCRWDADEGEVSEATTWHEGEPGYSLDSPGSSVSRTLTHLDGCLIFDLLVDSDPTAKVELQVDFEDDGTSTPREPSRPAISTCTQLSCLYPNKPKPYAQRWFR